MKGHPTSSSKTSVITQDEFHQSNLSNQNTWKSFSFKNKATNHMKPYLFQASKPPAIYRKNSEPNLKDRFPKNNQKQVFSSATSLSTTSTLSSTKSTIKSGKSSLLKILSKSTSHLAIFSSSRAEVSSKTYFIGNKYTKKTSENTTNKRILTRSKSGGPELTKPTIRRIPGNGPKTSSFSDNVPKTDEELSDNITTDIDEGKDFRIKMYFFFSGNVFPLITSQRMLTIINCHTYSTYFHY